MKNEINNDLKEFRKLLKAGTSEKEKEYKQAKIAYEKALKKSVISNITGRKNFKEMYQGSFDQARDCYQYERGDWAVDHLMTLKWMIDDFEMWLEDGQFETEEDFN
jgi:hypothetical protein